MRCPRTVTTCLRFDRSIQPRSACAARRSRHGSGGDFGSGGRLHEVPVRGLRPRSEVVVVAEDERARHVQQRAERGHRHRDRLGVRQGVAGVDHQVRPQIGQRADPGGLVVHARA